MSPELNAFLTAEDLDEAQDALRLLADLSTSDQAEIRSVLQRWHPPQAISNLLVYPILIPQDIRLTVLFLALDERRVAYHVLAAVVGFQSIDPETLTGAERKRLVEKLLLIVRHTRGVLAQRAVISLQRFLRVKDAPSVFALRAHPDDTVWHNLRAWLFRTFQGRGGREFSEAAHESGLSEEAERGLVGDFSELVADPYRFQSWMCELFSYIPNLRDVQQSADPSRFV